MRSSYPLWSKRRPRPDSGFGFTLLEMLVGLTVILLILAAVGQFIGGMEQIARLSSRDPYAEAEDAFENMAIRLQAATLEPYGDYADKTGSFRTNAAQSFIPDHVAIRSDLDFVCSTPSLPPGLWAGCNRITTGAGLFFLTPRGYSQSLDHTGMERLLNAAGYFVEFGDSESMPSFVGTHTWRWRLKEFQQPSENLEIYAAKPPLTWIQDALQPGAPLSVLAENVFLLIALPERAASDAGAPLAPHYGYESRDATQPASYGQLPSRVRLAIGAIDTASAQIVSNRFGSSPPSLIPSGLFSDASQMDADLATLDQSLTAQKIGHRFFQRTIQLPAAITTVATP